MLVLVTSNLLNSPQKKLQIYQGTTAKFNQRFSIGGVVDETEGRSHNNKEVQFFFY